MLLPDVLKAASQGTQTVLLGGLLGCKGVFLAPVGEAPDDAVLGALRPGSPGGLSSIDGAVEQVGL